MQEEGQSLEFSGAALFCFGMKLVRRRLQRGETDWELVLGVLWTPLFFITAAGLLLMPPRWVPACRFHGWTGIACPTCGAFRAGRALLNGDFGVAFRLQPLVCLVVAGLSVYSLYAWIVVVGRFPRLRVDGMSRTLQRGILGAAFAALLLNWAWLLLDGR